VGCRKTSQRYPHSLAKTKLQAKVMRFILFDETGEAKIVAWNEKQKNWQKHSIKQTGQTSECTDQVRFQQ